MYTTRKHSTYILSDTSAEVCRKGKEGSQTPRKQNHPPWQVNPPADLHTRGLLFTSRPMKKEMGLTLTGSNFSLKTEGPSFSKGTGLNSSKKQKKVGRWVKRKPDLCIHPSIPSLFGSWQRKGQANCNSSQCSSRHIKEERFPSG